jgi:hypothetical protein
MVPNKLFVYLQLVENAQSLLLTAKYYGNTGELSKESLHGILSLRKSLSFDQ